MTQVNTGHPNPKDLIRDIQEFVKNTPPDVVKRMRDRQAEGREPQSPESMGELMTKRLG